MGLRFEYGYRARKTLVKLLDTSNYKALIKTLRRQEKYGLYTLNNAQSQNVLITIKRGRGNKETSYYELIPRIANKQLIQGINKAVHKDNYLNNEELNYEPSVVPRLYH